MEQAQSLVAKLPETRFLRCSSIHETDPVGGRLQGKYLNAVWEVETSLSPRELKNHLREIEKRLGRKPADPNSPRQIDLDILFYGDQVVEEPDLHIPHRRLHERGFVLEPLAELVPELVHPILKRNVKELMMTLRIR